MNTRAMMYLEEYARALSEEVNTLLEQRYVDSDMDAGIQARNLEEKIKDIRHIVAVMSQKLHLEAHDRKM